MKRKVLFRVVPGVLVAFTALFYAGCTTEESDSAGGAVYIVDSNQGRIYTFDPATGVASSTPLLTIGQNASGAIYFYNDIGYVCVASYNNTAPGVYTFDPNAAVPTATRIGDAISAGYMAFYSDTKAYVTARSWGVSTGVYTFDPSDPDSGLTGPLEGTTKAGKAGRYLEGIVVGPDEMIYAADYDEMGSNGQVLRIDPSTDTVTAIFDMTASGTTDLLAGTDAAGNGVVYAANGGGYDYTTWMPLPGSIDMIDCSTGTVSTAVSGTSVTQLDSGSGTVFAVGSGNTCFFSPAGTAPYTATEVLDRDDLPFGGSDVLVSGDYVYIPNADWMTGENKLYVLYTDTAEQKSLSPLSIMVDGEDSAAAVAAY